MGDNNSIHLGDNAQAKQVAAGQNISQTIIENYIERARPLDARFSIPAPPRDFTGRVDEIETLVNALTRGQGASITGVSGLGGIGKSALAMVVAERVAEHFPDARLWVALNGTDANPKTPPDAMREIIFSFDPDTGIALKDASNEQIAQVYRAVLQNQRALLVLDNARDNAQVRPLLQANVAFLVTSRAHLTEGGLHPLHLDVMRAADADAYLVSLCARLQGARELRELGALCGDLPLALRIAGSYLAERVSVRAENYVAQLKQKRLELLRVRGDDALNVEAVFAQSYQHLTLAHQVLFGALSVFPAPFTLQAAVYVWGLEEVQAEAALGELVRASFLECNVDDERYRLHDLLREFGARRMSEENKRDSHKRHAEFYEQVARAADKLYLQGNENILAGLKLFDDELPHIRAGQAWAAANMEHDNNAAHLCNEYPDAAAYVMQLRLSVREQIRWLEQAMSAARKLNDKWSEGNHLGNLGYAYRNLGEGRKAIEYHEQALKVMQDIGNKRAEGSILGNLGNAYADLGEVRRAMESYEQQLVIVREIGYGRGEGNALGNLGNAYADLGEVRKAIEFYEQALVIVREIGDKLNEGIHLGNLGIAYKNLGDVRKAIEFYEQSLAIKREIGDRRGQGNALANLGTAYKELGDMDRAKELWRAALEIYEAIEDPNAERVRGWLANG